MAPLTLNKHLGRLEKSQMVDFSIARTCRTLLGDAFHAMIPSLGQGANSAFEGAYRLARAVGAARGGDVEAALRAYECDQMERAHWIVEQSSSQGRAVYKDTDEFVKNQQKAQDQMWGIKFEPL